MRTFISIDLDKEKTKQNLIEVQKKITDTDSGEINLVKPDNFHITMKFLGDVEEPRINEVKQILEKYDEYPKKTLKVNEIGVFPHYGYIKVIWAGLEDDPDLSDVKNSLESDLSDLGFERDDKEFKPHITIGRVKKVWDKDSLVGLLKTLKNDESGKMKIDALKLKKSTLTSDGPIYKTLKEVKFS